MLDSARFWDQTAEKYAARPIKDIPAYEKTMEITRGRLQSGDAVLELGCGTGSTALLLAEHVKHITASDISENMIAIARRKAEEANVSNIDFTAAAIDAPRLAEGAPYDVVLAFNLLHLIKDADGAVRRAAELLKPGGYFISKTVCIGDKRGMWGVMIPIMQFLGRAPFVHYFKADEIERLITDAGFEIIETGTYPPPRSRLVVARKK